MVLVPVRGSYYQMATDSLGARDSRQVYLVTYSQADLVKYPSRREFADALVLVFSKDNNVIQWCCCLEDHENVGKHYHVAIKLERKQRLLKIKRFLLDYFGALFISTSQLF